MTEKSKRQTKAEIGKGSSEPGPGQRYINKEFKTFCEFYTIQFNCNYILHRTEIYKCSK